MKGKDKLDEVHQMALQAFGEEWSEITKISPQFKNREIRRKARVFYMSAYENGYMQMTMDELHKSMRAAADAITQFENAIDKLEKS